MVCSSSRSSRSRCVARVRELVNGSREKMPAFDPEPPAPSAIAVLRSGRARRRDPEPRIRPNRSSTTIFRDGCRTGRADNKGGTLVEQSRPEEDFRASEVPTLEKLLGSSRERPDWPRTCRPRRPLGPRDGRHGPTHPRNAENAAADAAGRRRQCHSRCLHALLAMEQGEPRPRCVHRAPASAPAAITDELVVEVTRRVLERLAPKRPAIWSGRSWARSPNV